MRFVFLSIAMVAFAFAGHAQEVTYDLKNQLITEDMQTLAPHIGGRVLSKALPAPMPEGAVSYSHEWPAIYFEADFTGQNIFLKFDDPANEYRVLIDTSPAITLAQPGRSQVAITGLQNGPHHIRLEKVTESAWIIGAFDGFYLPTDAQTGSAQPRPRQIEFIGDSDMTGYGIRSTTRSCTQDEVRLLSDAQIGYPALLAKAFDADYQVNAISGRGLVRNYGGTNPETALASVYPAVLPDVWQDADRVTYLDASWKPQLIVIGLGDNDFSTPLLPGEKWQSNDALIDDFAASYKTFLANLFQTDPTAALILVQFDGAMLTNAERQRLQDVQDTVLLNTARNLGFESVDLVTMATLATDRTACDYHASKADHQRRALYLEDFISAKPDFWQGKGG